MTLTKLRENPLFQLLNAQEKAWIEAYVKSHGDAAEATRLVYKTTTANATNQMMNRLLSEPRVINVINVWNGELLGEPSVDEYRQELWRQIKACKSDAAKAALMRLYGECRGWIRKNAPGPTTPTVDPAVLAEIENPKESK